jgi:aspartyl-tRNA(Asn)/glutamyl-tRNA(Gln) amidotransferase subunit A
MITTEILYKPVSELSKLLRARRISPVELTKACLARIEALDPKLHAFATVTPETALDQARAAEREIQSGKNRGPLHGVPCGIKDLVDTQGIRTTWGARPYADRVPREDATVVRRLREAGAVLLGKLAMIELAGGLGYSTPDSSLTGAALNPWSLDRWTCGSSSGSGAAVAAALVPFAIGSETWGSIICPASFCGISGLRPTFGRVSRRGVMALSWSLDKLGPLARSAADCETVLRIIEGHDPEDPYSADEPAGASSNPATAKSLRVGVLKPDFSKGGDASVGAAFDRAVDELKKAGVRIEETKLPELPFDSATSIILNAEVATAFEDLERGGQVRKLRSPDAPLAFVASRAIRGSDLVKAQRIRTLAQRAMSGFFGTWDLLLFPGEQTTALAADKDFSDENWPDPAGAVGNLCGLPAIAVPCGFGADGLPVSLTAMSGAFEESKAISLARFFQGISSWHEKRPPIDSRTS